MSGLNFSYESLDQIEDYYRTELDKGPEKQEVDNLQRRLARYLGQTLVEHVEGTWAISIGPVPAPAVAVPGVKGRCFEPSWPLSTFKRVRFPGLLRDRTKEWDLALCEAQLARLHAVRAQELVALRTDLGQLTGKAPARLDVNALGQLEEALLTVMAPDVTRSRRREVYTRAQLLLGTLFEEAVGAGEWTVEPDPINADFGHFNFAGYAPYRIVRAIVPGAPAGRLRDALMRQIAARGRKERRLTMKTGTWLVLSDLPRAISVNDLAKRIGHLRRAKIRQDGDMLVVEIDDGVPTRVTVSFSAEPHVSLENSELADRTHRPDLAKLGGRYEILFDLKRADEVYNALAVIAGELEMACGGVIYDATNSRFV